MCHYQYYLFICCSEEKEYDGVQVASVTMCSHCPPSSDSRLYDDDFFHCPNVSAECLGHSDYLCPECSRTYNMDDPSDDINRDNDPSDDFSDDSDEEYDYEYFYTDWDEVYA